MMTRLAKAIAAIVHSLAGFRRGLNGGSCAKLLVSDTKGGVTAAVGGAVGAAGAALLSSGFAEGADGAVPAADAPPGADGVVGAAAWAGSGGAGS